MFLSEVKLKGRAETKPPAQNRTSVISEIKLINADAT